MMLVYNEGRRHRLPLTHAKTNNLNEQSAFLHLPTACFSADVLRSLFDAELFGTRLRKRYPLRLLWDLGHPSHSSPYLARSPLVMASSTYSFPPVPSAFIPSTISVNEPSFVWSLAGQTFAWSAVHRRTSESSGFWLVIGWFPKFLENMLWL